MRDALLFLLTAGIHLLILAAEALNLPVLEWCLGIGTPRLGWPELAWDPRSTDRESHLKPAMRDTMSNPTPSPANPPRRDGYPPVSRDHLERGADEPTAGDGRLAQMAQT